MFNLLAVDGTDIRPKPYSARRAQLEALLAEQLPHGLVLMPMTTDFAVARIRILNHTSAGVAGVVTNALITRTGPVAGPGELIRTCLTAEAWPPSEGRGPCAVSNTSNVTVPMRDGTVLRADVYRPATTDPVPVILYRTQYDKTAAQVQPFRYQSPDWFASHCYLVVTEDIRGMYASAGTLSEFTHDQDDGYVEPPGPDEPKVVSRPHPVLPAGRRPGSARPTR